jgi:hypothetical protein
MGLHTPLHPDALSPALRSGNSNLEPGYRYRGRQDWGSSPAPKGVGEQRYPALAQSPIDVGRFLSGFPIASAPQEVCDLIGVS